MERAGRAAGDRPLHALQRVAHTSLLTWEGWSPWKFLGGDPTRPIVTLAAQQRTDGVGEGRCVGREYMLGNGSGGCSI